MTCFFVIGSLNIIWLAIYGYFIPANVRIGLSVPQVATTMSCLILMMPVNLAMLKGAKVAGPIQWGENAGKIAICPDRTGNGIYLDDGLDGLHPFVSSSLLACQ